MVHLGVINIITSFFGGIPVGGGDPARSAVLSGTQVKSPLTGIVTSVVVILAMSFGSRAFEWIPIPTIAAVITVAIANQILPMDWTLKWWKISFVDFLGFFMTFNVGLVSTGEMGLGLGFAIMIFYTLFRAMFSRPTALVSSDLESQYNGMNPPWWHKGDRIPSGTQVIKLETDVMFANAERIRRHVLILFSPIYQGPVSDIPQRKNEHGTIGETSVFSVCGERQRSAMPMNLLLVYVSWSLIFHLPHLLMARASTPSKISRKSSDLMVASKSNSALWA